MIYGFSPFGSSGHVVRVEVDVRRGLPGTDIVGLPSSEVRECRERVRVAIRNSGLVYPTDRILVSLSPAEIPKVGAGFDLPIALAILHQTGQIHLPDTLLAAGEVSIRGTLLPTRGILSAIIAAGEAHIPAVLLPRRALGAIAGMGQVIETLFAMESLEEAVRGYPEAVDPPEIPRSLQMGEPSMDDVAGQDHAKRAAMISTAGFHNIMFMGPPGSGKTMTARRMIDIMPPLTRHDALEVARIHSLRGLERSGLVTTPPVRMPHHSVSQEGMLGGGRNLLPGEISLAHRGILVLDEATEFQPRVLQALREPVEERYVSISRAGQIEQFPTSFILALTTNLCPCGGLGQPGKLCLCSVQEIARYWRRVGAALMDRVDIRVVTVPQFYQTPVPSPVSHPPAASATADQMRSQVRIAIERQTHRGAQRRWKRNGLVPPGMVESLLPVPQPLVTLIQELMKEHGLSDRAAHSVRAVARTIADLADRETVGETDIREAVALRVIGADSLLGRGEA